MQVLAARPADVSADAWLLSIAISSILPAAIYLGMTWRVLHAIKHSSPELHQSSQDESDRAVAVVAAVCIKNAQTIERLITLIDGLDSHPSLGGLWSAVHLSCSAMCRAMPAITQFSTSMHTSGAVWTSPESQVGNTECTSL